MVKQCNTTVLRALAAGPAKTSALLATDPAKKCVFFTHTAARQSFIVTFCFRTYDLSPLNLSSSSHNAENNSHQQRGGAFRPTFAELFLALCVEPYKSRGDKS